MSEHPRTYEEGLRDGRLTNLEGTVVKHSDRLDSHSHRIRSMERVIYILVGAAALIEFAPKILAFLGK